MKFSYRMKLESFADPEGTDLRILVRIQDSVGAFKITVRFFKGNTTSIDMGGTWTPLTRFTGGLRSLNPSKLAFVISPPKTFIGAL
jgi:hypothetical protein